MEMGAAKDSLRSQFLLFRPMMQSGQNAVALRSFILFFSPCNQDGVS